MDAAPEAPPSNEHVLQDGATDRTTPAEDPASREEQRKLELEEKIQLLSLRRPDDDVDEAAANAFLKVQATSKVAILGGMGSGKTHLFFAMIQRCRNPKHAGALSGHLDKAFTYRSRHRLEPRDKLVRYHDVLKAYKSWVRTKNTDRNDEWWYRLRLGYRSGVLGLTRSCIDVDFFDGSGENYESASREAACLDAVDGARIVVFCLPMWAAFPRQEYLDDAEFVENKWRKQIDGFENVVATFIELRRKMKKTRKVRTVLALTMADDERCSLADVQRRWIRPFQEVGEDDTVRNDLYDQLRNGPGLMRYLASARKVSDYLRERLGRSARGDQTIAGICSTLELGDGEPWIVPVSALDGSKLVETYEQSREVHGPAPHPPVPAHVELPLLLALCEEHGALI